MPHRETLLKRRPPAPLDPPPGFIRSRLADSARHLRPPPVFPHIPLDICAHAQRRPPPHARSHAAFAPPRRFHTRHWLDVTNDTRRNDTRRLTESPRRPWPGPPQSRVDLRGAAGGPGRGLLGPARPRPGGTPRPLRLAGAVTAAAAARTAPPPPRRRAHISGGTGTCVDTATAAAALVCVGWPVARSRCRHDCGGYAAMPVVAQLRPLPSSLRAGPACDCVQSWCGPVDG
jgi:hypothetical protein